MKTNYIEPQVEIIEIELECVLCESVEDMNGNGSVGDY